MFAQATGKWRYLLLTRHVGPLSAPSFQVDFEVQMDPETLNEWEAAGLEKKFDLVGSIPASNLVCFDRNGRICKYASVADIVKEFFGIRSVKIFVFTSPLPRLVLFFFQFPVVYDFSHLILRTRLLGGVGPTGVLPQAQGPLGGEPE